MTTIEARMFQRRADAADWTADNPVLNAGEFGYETDTGRLKMGDGTTAWNALGYFPGPADLALKANQSDLVTLQGLVADKANQTALDALSATVATKPSETEVVDLIEETFDESSLVLPRYRQRELLAGPVATDTPTITSGEPGSALSAYDENYAIASNTKPAVWPVSTYGKEAISNNTLLLATSQTGQWGYGTYRFMADGTDIMLLTIGVLAGAGYTMDIYVDGRPLAANPVTLVSTSGYGGYSLTSVVFGSAKPRLIEVRTAAGFAAVHTKKPYRLWKPPLEASGVRMAVVGDSLVRPTVMNNASAGMVTVGGLDEGIYQRLAAMLGTLMVTTDGIGGSGYIHSATPYGHITRKQWLIDVNPNVIVVHGGGANDLFQGNSTAAIITAATTYFQDLRTQFPNAKLVFVEGFSGPVFAYNSDYTAIRTGVQANLASMDRQPYYLDIATTRPPITGTGYVTATSGNNNSNIYIGSDAVHLTGLGNIYARAVVAQKLKRVLEDDGALEGTLIY